VRLLTVVNIEYPYRISGATAGQNSRLWTSKLINPDSKTAYRTNVGTGICKAPEVWLDEPYTTAVDMWSLGCILYWLIAGKTPFKHIAEIFDYVKGQNPSDNWLSMLELDMERPVVSKLLQAKPENRMTIHDVMESN
jgi:serine/threonine protein kinase